MNEIERNLNTLSLFHYIAGAIFVVFACIPLIHVGIGIAMISAPESFVADNGQVPPEVLGYFFTAVGILFFLAGQALACAVIYAGRCLKQRKMYTYCFVTGCVSCMAVPFGTILGVFTIVLLSKDETKALFAKA